MRLFSKIGLAAACSVISAAPALALGGGSGGFTNPMKNSDGSAAFIDGAWSFDTWAPGPAHPGFHYSGTLKDTKADGDWVYTRGKVDGYGWGGGSSAENHRGSGKTVVVAQKVWGADPPSEAKMEVCRHRAGIYPNICVESAWKRPR